MEPKNPTGLSFQIQSEWKMLHINNLFWRTRPTSNGTSLTFTRVELPAPKPITREMECSALTLFCACPLPRCECLVMFFSTLANICLHFQRQHMAVQTCFPVKCRDAHELQIGLDHVLWKHMKSSFGSIYWREFPCSLSLILDTVCGKLPNWD